MKIVTVVQARMSSSRLPGKVMLPLCGEPLLVKMLERLAHAKNVGKIVVATTKDAEDDAIASLCEANHVAVYRGSKYDLLDRHYQVGHMYKADAVVKIPSDCPLIDPAVIDKVIGYYLDHQHKYDYVSNLHPASYPDGNDVEIMSMKALEKAWESATAKLELEHTTPFIWENQNLFRIGNVKWETGLDYSMTHRWTIDYPEDYQFIEAIYNQLYPIKNIFSITEILELLEAQPEIQSINQKWAGVNWYRHHLDELKTVGKNQTKLIEEAP